MPLYLSEQLCSWKRFCVRAHFETTPLFTNWLLWLTALVVICLRPNLFFLYCQYIAHHMYHILSNNLSFFELQLYFWLILCASLKCLLLKVHVPFIFLHKWQGDLSLHMAWTYLPYPSLLILIVPSVPLSFYSLNAHHQMQEPHVLLLKSF